MLPTTARCVFVKQSRVLFSIVKHRYQNILPILQCSQTIPEMSRKKYATCGGQSSARKITFQPYVKPCEEDHDHKNMRLNRPMSPHLTIFIPTVTSVTSILQRITGTIVTFYTVSVASAALFLSNGIDTYISIIQSFHLPGFMIFLVKILIGLPFSFHYFNGIRFVLFNAGKGFSKAEIFNSSKVATICSVIVSVLFAFL